jgi:hypothetical protein
MTAPGAPPPRRRWLRLFVQLTIAGVILLAIGTVGFVEYSAQPSFCKHCHNMVPYYESWKTSSHKDVKCILCHYAPGIKAEAMGKLQAANQVVKYITKQYGMKPWAEIDDAACLRSGCHVEAKLSAEVDFKGVRFSHADHLGELRRGKQLRCTSCHSQIVQGAHVAVTEETCFLCHFKERRTAEPVAGCIGCHPAPPRVERPDGVVVDHPQFVQDLVSCLSCHAQVVRGTGDVDQSRCFHCHNEPARLQEYTNSALLHRKHIAEHKVECTQCHAPIQHRMEAPAAIPAAGPSLDCGSCHQGVHVAQQRLLAGVGGHGTEDLPSAMYLARVSCKSCHELNRQTRGHENVQAAGEASCMACHGTRYANILPTWQREMTQRLERVERVVHGAEGVRGSASAGARRAVDSLLGLARANVELVRVGRGAHNVGYADRLLRAAVALTRRAVAAGGLPYDVGGVDLGPPLDRNACLQCHLGVERQTGTFEGARFPHERHVVNGGLGCAACHTPLEDHGKITLGSTADCQGCHHRGAEPSTCGRCHAGANGVPAGVIPLPAGDFAHAVHVGIGLPCATCHQSPTMSAANLTCDNCHGAHHLPGATCLACHRAETGVKAKHMQAAIAHRPCTGCHGDKVAGLTQWSRQVCTVCHTDRVQHNAPVACDRCHQMTPLSGAGG